MYAGRYTPLTTSFPVLLAPLLAAVLSESEVTSNAGLGNVSCIPSSDVYLWVVILKMIMLETIQKEYTFMVHVKFRLNQIGKEGTVQYQGHIDPIMAARYVLDNTESASGTVNDKDSGSNYTVKFDGVAGTEGIKDKPT